MSEKRRKKNTFEIKTTINMHKSYSKIKNK